MKRPFALAGLIITLSAQVAFCQKTIQYNWWNPAESNFSVIQGQTWPKEVAQFYDRLLARAKKEVNQSVWERSQDAAGLTIRFYSNAPAIRVRYTVSGRKDQEKRIAGLNKQIAWLCSQENVAYINPGRLLLDSSRKLNKSLFAVGPHPDKEGHRILAKAMAPYLVPLNE
ncbi:MAG TPA: SGNH/GDSL hydrolase N-terminal domain-containing protein [Chitinophagaceae bacterium]|nr:SGNH/GDSL hydrolase N-terminal domain-containing protein [Chitinophagaceae bacterium]